MTAPGVPSIEELDHTIESAATLMDSWGVLGVDAPSPDRRLPRSDPRVQLVRELVSKAMWTRFSIEDEALLEAAKLLEPLRKTSTKISALLKGSEAAARGSADADGVQMNPAFRVGAEDASLVVEAVNRLSERFDFIAKNRDWDAYGKQVRQELALLDVDLDDVMALFVFSDATRPRERTRLTKYVREHAPQPAQSLA